MEQEELAGWAAARATLLEMCRDRGYKVPEAEHSAEELQQMFAAYATTGHFLVFADAAEVPVACIMVKNDKSISNKTVETLAAKMKEREIARTLLVSNQPLSAGAEKILRELEAESRMVIEFFSLNDLMVNITRHEMVPPHALCSEEEKQLVLRKFRAKEGQLPKILVTDPVARYYGARKGQLVRIVRPSETAGLCVVYRICV